MPLAKWMLSLCWWLLATVQIAWHGLLTPPLGNGNWLLALVAVAPLLFMAPLALHRGARGRFWGMFLVMLYFIIAVTEAWSNAAQRLFAVLQLLLCVGYFAALIGFSRQAKTR